MAPRPFAGSTIPTISGAHLNIATALMFPSIGTGIRREFSAVDILANAEISDFTTINLDQRAIPVAPSLLLLFGGGLALVIARRRGRTA